MTGKARHERLVIDRHRGDAVQVSTTDPRETQRAMEREALALATGVVLRGAVVVWP